MTDEQLDAPHSYLIVKRGAYYRPMCQGYTASAIQAGRYTLAEAERYTHPNGPDGPRDDMRYIHEDDVNCEDWKAYRALRTALAASSARAAELEAERYALSLAICGGEDAPGYAASLTVAVLEEVARSNRRYADDELTRANRNLEHWRQEVGKLHSKLGTAQDREAAAVAAALEGVCAICKRWHDKALIRSDNNPDDATHAATACTAASLDREIRALITPAQAAHDKRVRDAARTVKPLVWVEEDGGDVFTSRSHGTKRIYRSDGGGYYVPSIYPSNFDRVEDAIAAIQSQHEARVLSALIDAGGAS